MSIIRDVAQSGSALRSGRRSREFKSPHPDIFLKMNENILKKTDSLLLDESYLTDKININAIVFLLIDKIRDLSRELSISGDELYIIIDEAVTNAIEHGNCWDTNKAIHVKARIDSTCLHIGITDEGTGFKISEMRREQKMRDIHACRGRGILLISRFCTPRWNRKGNQISLSIDLK